MTGMCFRVFLIVNLIKILTKIILQFRYIEVLFRYCIYLLTYILLEIARSSERNNSENSVSIEALLGAEKSLVTNAACNAFSNSIQKKL